MPLSREGLETGSVPSGTRSGRSKARLSIHRLSICVAAELQLQLERMLLQLHSGGAESTGSGGGGGGTKNKRVTPSGEVRVCEGGELAAISPAGLTSDTRHLQILCQKKKKASG